MKLAGAIFDVDGTLLDSMAIWDTVGERYLRSLGYQPRERLSEVFHSMSLQQAARYYREHYGVPQSEEEIIRGVNALLERRYREEAVLKPGARELLQRLRQQGVRLGIATATGRHLTEAALSRLGVREYFSVLLTCGETGHGKDEPHIFEAALRALGTRREETLVFEDALYAIRTAKAAGFFVAAVYDAYEPQPEQVRALADFYLRDFSEKNLPFPL